MIFKVPCYTLQCMCISLPVRGKRRCFVLSSRLAMPSVWETWYTVSFLSASVTVPPQRADGDCEGWGCLWKATRRSNWSGAQGRGTPLNNAKPLVGPWQPQMCLILAFLAGWVLESSLWKWNCSFPERETQQGYFFLSPYAMFRESGKDAASHGFSRGAASQKPCPRGGREEGCQPSWPEASRLSLS